MPSSTSYLSYLDCIKLMDQALENTKGIKVEFENMGSARHYRTRLHMARSICRRDNAKAFDKEHPMYGRSIYDPLVVREPREEEGAIWLYIEKLSIDQLTILPLGEPEPEGHLGFVERKALPMPEEEETPTIPVEEITVFDPPKQVRRV